MIAPISPAGAAAPGDVALRALRYAIRIPLLLWHLLVHLPLVLLLLTRLTRRWRWPLGCDALETYNAGHVAPCHLFRPLVRTHRSDRVGQHRAIAQGDRSRGA